MYKKVPTANSAPGFFLSSVALIVLIALLLNIHLIVVAMTSSSSQSGQKSSKLDDERRPNVLIVGHYASIEQSLMDEAEKCHYACNFVREPPTEKEANAVVVVDNATVPAAVLHQRTSNQLWAHLSLEPAGLRRNPSVNLTISYHPDADIQLVKVMFEEVNGTTEVGNAGRRREVATIMDQCTSKSNRESYIDHMQRHISVDVYGACGTPCPGHSRADCLDYLDRHYQFFLVFEPHLCQHYVSTRLWTTLANTRRMVPIVFGGVEYSKILPENSYIDALNQSPEELAKYLRLLIRQENGTLLKQYRRWRESLRVTYSEWPCSLCQMLRNGEEEIVKPEAGSGEERKKSLEVQPQEEPRCTSWPDLDFQ